MQLGHTVAQQTSEFWQISCGAGANYKQGLFLELRADVLAHGRGAGHKKGVASPHTQAIPRGYLLILQGHCKRYLHPGDPVVNL